VWPCEPLSTQKSIRDVVENNRIHTEVWTVGDPSIPITKQLSKSAGCR